MRPASSPATVANAFTPAYRTQPRHSCLIDLFSQSDPEPHYAVTALIPAGITVLGSKSLTHLTTLAVSLSISISLGESALNRLPAPKTGVLYLTTNPAAAQRHFRDLDPTNKHS